jgi:F-type H+-transporting ATPase subunit gamma
VLVVTSERGLCGAFNEHLLGRVLQYARHMNAQGQAVSMLCLGSRGRRLLEAAGEAICYAKPMSSLSVPSYVDIEGIALDLLELVEQGSIGRLVVLHNAPVRRFQYEHTIQTLLPPALADVKRHQGRVVVKPNDDAPLLMTHLLTEHLIIDLSRVLRESVISEQLARVQTMRLATENARKLLTKLTLDCHLARSQAVTNALLEVIAGYEVTTQRGS